MNLRLDLPMIETPDMNHTKLKSLFLPDGELFSSSPVYCKTQPYSLTNRKDIEMLVKVGKIAHEAKKFARKYIRKGLLLVEIAESIEAKIKELGGKPAFPVGLAMNEIVAHDTPAYDDQRTVSGLLKVDLGARINGYLADTAFSIDLEDSKENLALIEASEKALQNVSENLRYDMEIRDIGRLIEEAVVLSGVRPIFNLYSHSLHRACLHTHDTFIPNYDDQNGAQLGIGVYAIEPFATNGIGITRNGKPSGIYSYISMQKENSDLDGLAKRVLSHIRDEYPTLPFCSRWIYRRFGKQGINTLQRLGSANIIYQYFDIVEASRGKVAQTENTFVLTGKEKIVTT